MAPRVSSSRFVGREVELTRLATIWKTAITDERAATVLVSGEAGVGKSRLVAEFVHGIPQPALVMTGQCMELVDRALPFGPVVQILRALHKMLDDATLDAVVGPARDEVGVLLPDLHGSTRANVESGALFEQLLGVFERLAERVPTVVIVEDLHWADGSTRQLFAFLARSLRDAPLLLLGTYRSDDLHRRHPLRTVLAELDRSGVVERVDVSRFDRDEVRELVTGIVGGQPSKDLVDRTFERSDGNAFFAEELLAVGDACAALPQTLRDIVLARIDTLPDDTQHVLRCAAIIGPSVDHRLLAATAEFDDARLLPALRAAVEAQVLLTDGDGLEYRFRHALVQEAVEDDLLPGDRVALHTRVAELLSQHAHWFDGGRIQLAAELACHWSAAGNAPHALEAAVDAAHVAESMYAYSESLAHTERALSLWDEVADAEARVRLRHVDLMRYAAVQAEMSGNVDRALDYIRGALTEIDPGADPVTAGLLHERWGRYAWMLSHSWDEVLEHCNEAVRLIPDEPMAARARVLATCGQHLMLAGKSNDAISMCLAAIDVAQAAGERVIEGHARNSLGSMLAGIGRSEEGLAELHRAREIALEMNAWDDVARAAVNEGGALQTLARHEEALAISIEGADMARAHGLDRIFGTFLRLNANESLWELGRWSEFDEQLREVVAIDPVGIDEWRICTQGALLAIAHGRFADARGKLARIREVLQPRGNVHDALNIERVSVAIALWEGNLDDAFAQARAAMTSEHDHATLCNDDALHILFDGLVAAASLARRGDGSLDVSSVREFTTMLERWAAGERWGGGLPGDFEAIRAYVAAEVARAEGSDTAVMWNDVAHAWSGYGMRPRAAYAWWRAAEAAVHAGDRDAATSAARAAYEIAAVIGWVCLRDAVANLARRARLEVDVPDDVAPTAAERFGLTTRELDVLGLVAAGRTNRQIAETLFISVKTASVHVSNILAKLGVANRGEAAAAARRLDLDLRPVDS